MFRRSSDKIETIIGPGVILKGSLKAQSSVRVDGTVEGEIEADGNVVVGEKADIKANITAQNVTIAGLVRGNVFARGRLEITAKGKVLGDISTATLSIEEGGIFQGRSTMPHETPGQEEGS